MVSLNTPPLCKGALGSCILRFRPHCKWVVEWYRSLHCHISGASMGSDVLQCTKARHECTATLQGGSG